MDYTLNIKHCISAAREAGAEILKIYHHPESDFGIQMKADNSPLTLADKAAHRCILSRLEPLGIPVLSEEGIHLPYSQRKEWKRLWVVDPLDGTKEFIKKNGEFTVNIALIEDGVPVLGVVYVPVTDTLYYGMQSQGAWKQVGENPATPLTGKREATDGIFRVVASRSHLNAETLAYVEEMRRIHGQVEMVSRGSSLKICMVAEGEADAYPRFAPTMEWDTAAGDAIARSVGKQVINVETGTSLLYNKEELLNPWFLVE